MRRKVLTAALVPLSLILGLALFEGMLRTGLLDDLSIHWFPPHYKAIDEARLAGGGKLSRRHPFRFREVIQGPAMPSTAAARIAVLGDSFVWGHGLHYTDSWAQQFKVKVGASHPSIQVVTWARNGWSTKDELDFLKATAAQDEMFEADLLLVGFVVNDLDLRDGNWVRWRKEVKWDETWLAPLGAVLPYTWDFLTGHLDALLEVVTDDHGQANWMTHMWSESNLAKYVKVLEELKSLTETMGVPLLMIITPRDTNHAYYDNKLDRITALFDQVGLSWINLFGIMEERFGAMGDNPRLYWANPANAHPGPEIGALMASAVHDHLMDKGTLDRLVERRRVRWVDRVEMLPNCGKNKRFKTLMRRPRATEAGTQRYLGISGAAFFLERRQMLALNAVAVKTEAGLHPAFYGMSTEMHLPNGRKVTAPFGFSVDLPHGDDGEAPVVTGLILETRNFGCRSVVLF